MYLYSTDQPYMIPIHQILNGDLFQAKIRFKLLKSYFKELLSIGVHVSSFMHNFVTVFLFLIYATRISKYYKYI